MNAQFSAISRLIERANKLLECGPECQRVKQLKETQQKYLDSKTNLLTAPEQVNTSAKNFFTLYKGESGYNDFQEIQLRERVEIIGKEMETSFFADTDNALNINESYAGLYINSRHIVELYKDYLKQNVFLEKKLKELSSDILTNDRRTYYTDQGSDSLTWWHTVFWWIYCGITSAFFICIFIADSNVSFMAKLFIWIVLILFPYLIESIMFWSSSTLQKMYALLPKNAYLTI